MIRRALIGTLLALPLLGAFCDVEPPCGRADLAPLPQLPAYAVISSDYLSTAIAVLDEEGDPITDAWIDSGTTRPGLSLTLNDVVFPTEALGTNVLTVIDRLGVDIVTQIALPSGEILRQLPTAPSEPRGGAAFRANPHDVVPLDERHLLISRFEPNLDPAAPPLALGNDLVILDTETRTIVDAIPLGALDGLEDLDGQPARAYARPSRMVRVGSLIVVGLARLTSDWRAAEGAVAIVDPNTRAAVALELPGLSNCASVVAIRGATDRVLVVCSGRPFTDENGRRATAGVAIVSIDSDGHAALEHVLRAAEHPEAPVITGGAISIDGRHTVLTAMGDDRVDRPDRLVRLDLARDAIEVILDAEEAYVLGTGTFDPERRLLLVPDATVGVRRFRVVDGEIEPLEPSSVSRCAGLGARQVTRLSTSRAVASTHVEDSSQPLQAFVVGGRGTKLREISFECVAQR